MKAKIGDFTNNAEKTQDNDFMMVEMAQGHTDALENVATVTYFDRAAFIHLFFTNATLTAQILKLYKRQGKIAAEVVTLQTEAAKCKCGGCGGTIPFPTLLQPGIQLDTPWVRG